MVFQTHDKCTKVDGPIIIGAGPSGLAVYACLLSHGVPSLILEKTDCIASLWQQRAYDRLKLHLPKHVCELPLVGFPQSVPKYPTRQQFIAYIKFYTSYFSIEPHFNQCVQSAEFDNVGGIWRVKTQDSEYISKWVIVATGENADPLIPQISGLDKFCGPIVHTLEYKSGSSFKNKKVLVIGCGNSGMEVSFDLANHDAITDIVVRSPVHVLPKEMFGFSTFGVAMELGKWLPLNLVDKFLLTMANLLLGDLDKFGLHRPQRGPIELKNVEGRSPVLDVGTLSMIKAGKVKVVNGVKEITKNGAIFVNGEKEYDAIILATGYKSNVLNWLQRCDFFGKEGMPKNPFPNNWKGENGLYAVGFTRRGIFGASKDAVKIAQDISNQWKTLNNTKKYL